MQEAEFDYFLVAEKGNQGLASPILLDKKQANDILVDHYLQEMDLDTMTEDQLYPIICTYVVKRKRKSI
jgi:hypothetical protein